MVLLNKCCCFFQLSTGGVILGWIGAVSSLLRVVFTTVGLSDSDFRGLPIDAPIHFGLAAMLVSSLVGLLSSTMLVAGTIKRNPLYLLPWLFGEGISTVVLLAMSMISLSTPYKELFVLLAIITGELTYENIVQSLTNNLI